VRKDGTSVYRPPNEARYTTTGQLGLESRIMELARRKRPVMVTEAQAREAVATFDLDESQAEAVVTMLTSDAAVTLLTAPAGTGKTHTVSVFAQLWAELTGAKVIGLATSENAARVMAAEGLSAAYNIAAFLGKVEGSDELRYPIPIQAGDKLVLDDHAGLVNAIASVLPGAAWQRCRAHSRRSLLTRVPKTAQPRYRPMVRAIFEQPGAASVRARHAHVVQALEARLPAAAAHLDAARDDILALTAFPRRGLAADLVRQPAGAAEQGGQAPHRRGRHLPRPRGHHPPGRRGAGRAGRRRDRVPPLYGPGNPRRLPESRTARDGAE
jgi:Transposase, Mutator family/AAA domain